MTPDPEVFDDAANLEEESAELEDQSQGTADDNLEPAEPTMADLARELAPVLTPILLGQLQPMFDNLYRGTQTQVDRLARQLATETGATKAEYEQVRAYLKALMVPEAADALEKELDYERLKRQRDNPPAKAEAEPEPQSQPPMTDDQWRGWYAVNIGADIDAYGAEAGFTQAQINDGPAWTALLHLHGAPAQLADLRPETIRAYKNGHYAAIKKAAEARRVASRPKASPDTRTGGTTGRPRFTREQIANMTPDEVRANKDAIFASLGSRSGDS